MQRGLAPVLLILGVVLFFGVGMAVYLLVVKPQGPIYMDPFPAPNTKACTLETKICPDGSSVGKSGPNCEFAACPSVQPSSVVSSSADKTNWQLFGGKGYSFRYPVADILGVNDSYKDSVFLQKNAEYTNGGGPGGSNVLKKGAIFSFTNLPSKDLSLDGLKKQYGTDIATQVVEIDGRQGVEVLFPQVTTYNSGGRLMYFKLNNTVLEISSGFGTENSAAENQIYSSEFVQILATFKFN